MTRWTERLLNEGLLNIVRTTPRHVRVLGTEDSRSLRIGSDDVGVRRQLVMDRLVVEAAELNEGQQRRPGVMNDRTRPNSSGWVL